MTDHAVTIVVSVNNDAVLNQNLLVSPGLLENGRNQLLLRRGFPSAALAYNSAIDEAVNDTIIFVHQDIYLPEDWLSSLRQAIARLDKTAPNWGVLGPYGAKKGVSGGVGRIYTRGLGVHGMPLETPEPIETLDEIVLVIRKSAGLRFDSDLAHFHLYGSDICMTARERGLVNYAFQGYCVHNTNQLLILPDEFYACYRYMRKKWAHRLPIQTSCIRISFFNEAYYTRRTIEAKQRRFGMRSKPAKRVDDPRVFAGAINATSASPDRDRPAE